MLYPQNIEGYDGVYVAHSDGRVWSNKSKRFLNPKKKKSGYKYVNLSKNGKRKYLSIHRLICKTFNKGNNKENLCVDHIDRNRCNNAASNLRFVTKKENSQNMGISTRNTSGYVGVSWHKTRKVWNAHYSNEEGKQVNKTFKTLIEASEWRRSMRELHYIQSLYTQEERPARFTESGPSTGNAV